VGERGGGGGGGGGRAIQKIEKGPFVLKKGGGGVLGV